MFDLDGKCALVTGASGGIGGAVARALHGRGATVTLSGTRTGPLDALAGELGVRVYVAPCDLSDGAAVEALPKKVTELMGAWTSSSTTPASPATSSSCACRMTTGRRCWR